MFMRNTTTYKWLSLLGVIVWQFCANVYTKLKGLGTFSVEGRFSLSASSGAVSPSDAGIISPLYYEQNTYLYIIHFEVVNTRLPRPTCDVH